MIERSIVTVRLYPDGRLDSASAAAYVGLNEKTMANYRCKGIGPKFVKRGKIFYFKDDLDAWLNEGRAQSTAQARCQAGANGATV
ncbi:MAG: helix-turn-helix domain-containing protein [Methylococcaceae bacterium]|nr:helix-turn-helix domain-containing protein [Methylococcaceae bacterium]